MTWQAWVTRMLVLAAGVLALGEITGYLVGIPVWIAALMGVWFYIMIHVWRNDR